eukprot:scaffold8165_cov116-Isochrysis_galbana.AAC.2
MLRSRGRWSLTRRPIHIVTHVVWETRLRTGTAANGLAFDAPRESRACDSGGTSSAGCFRHCSRVCRRAGCDASGWWRRRSDKSQRTETERGLPRKPGEETGECGLGGKLRGPPHHAHPGAWPHEDGGHNAPRARATIIKKLVGWPVHIHPHRAEWSQAVGIDPDAQLLSQLCRVLLGRLAVLRLYRAATARPGRWRLERELQDCGPSMIRQHADLVGPIAQTLRIDVLRPPEV